MYLTTGHVGYKTALFAVMCNEKMAARMVKQANRMKTIVKPYRFDDSDPETVFSFLG